MLELKSINKKVGNFQINNLSLRLEENEYLVLLGPSGSGKTMLLEIIAGLIQPDSGSILWKEKDITGLPPENRNFSIVYQDYALFPHLNILDNICYGLRARGEKKKDAVLMAEKAANKLQIGALLSRMPASLSGGERQRVALARSLVTGAELLLLDEPLSALDGEARHRLQQELLQIQEESRTTFIHVTHDVTEADTLGNRIGMMRDGQLKF